MPRSSRLETHDHSTCGFMAWCRKSGAQVAGKLENSTAIVAADGEKSARIDLKVLPAFDKCPNEGKDEQLRSLLQHSFDELKLRYDGHVARFDCLTLCLIRCSHTHRKCFDFYNMHKVSPWTLLPLHSGRGNIDPEHANAHYNLGDLLENKADYGGAEQHYRRARAIDPEEHADAHCELAGQARPSWCL